MHFCWEASGNPDAFCTEGVKYSEHPQPGECEECRKARKEKEVEEKKHETEAPPKRRKSVALRDDVEEIPSDDSGKASVTSSSIPGLI